MFILVLQRLAVEFVFDVLYFPIWWITAGLKYWLLKCIDLFLSGNSTLAPGLWLKNIFVPMFGQYDWQGRLTSFFVRLANVIVRGFGLCIWFAIVLVVLSLWIIVPAFVVYMFFRSLILI